MVNDGLEVNNGLDVNVFGLQLQCATMNIKETGSGKIDFTIKEHTNQD